ncbi:MAG: di-trans,poly-cis-decaprenylcistransferase [Nitrososphaerota archaeon]|nr:di-trans,poly-cis-decaprenylcistransferase [Nitrososphaerota archaeon]
MLESVLRYTGVYRIYEGRLRAQVEKEDIPSHIGIILDGNRRWAQEQGFSQGLGHEEGANRAEELLDWCHDLGIKTVTLYVLSTENLDRTPEELATLFELIQARLNRLLNDARIVKYGVKVRAIGHMDLLPGSIFDLLKAIEEKTEGYSNHYLNIAVAYGGRAEITDVLRSVARDVKSGKMDPDAISEDTVSKRLYTAFLPNQEPDLIIRTSGEERMSGFLLWQGAYSELLFVDVFWPAFRFIDLLRAIRTYQKRRRRYGK